MQHQQGLERDSCLHKTEVRNPAIAANVPRFIKESFINAKIFNNTVGSSKSGPKTIEQPLFFSPGSSKNTLQGSAERSRRSDDERSSELDYRYSSENSLEQLDDMNVYSEQSFANMANPLYPLNLPEMLNSDQNSNAESTIATAEEPEQSEFYDDLEEGEEEEDEILNRSLEEPIDNERPSFTEDESLETIVNYLEVYQS